MPETRNKRGDIQQLQRENMPLLALAAFVFLPYQMLVPRPSHLVLLLLTLSRTIAATGQYILLHAPKI